ncbi:D-alanyl-D-alanine carboxypeptidase/D-alanyl-D-alanine-endopeptidase [Shewanella waksmanii]|uniref:D-alanyl-D-alanine carboxypeptidase/D-alanyl-D-alanine endopeptidase n=1 Tax=Shewanella waksmanii TaxID=213783 RepID=UPI003735B7A5
MYKQLALSVLLCCFSPFGFAENNIANSLNVIQPPHSQLAIKVTDLVSGQLLFEKDANKLMVPASTQKLLTAVASAYVLGKQFTFKTQLSSAANVINGTLQGDLFIHFNGDPTLTSEQLRQLLRQLPKHGINRINGAVYLVGNTSDKVQAKGWVWDDLGICFAAPVSDFVINKNCIKAKLKPTLASNQSQIVYPNYLPTMISTTAIFDKTSQRQFCQLELTTLPENQYHISGCYQGNKPLPLTIAVSDPSLYVQKIVANLFEQTQIPVAQGIYVIEKSPKGLDVIATHQSKALPELLKRVLEDSDNLIADSLFKQIGASYYQQTGTFANGAKAMKNTLSELGVDIDHAQIVDGSGLSRYNLITANQLAQILTLIHTQTRFTYLNDLLAVSGKTGTLRHKPIFRRPPLQDIVSAKTGSMQGVDNLAGFIQGTDNARLLFVVLENGLSPHEKDNQIAPFNGLFLQLLLDSQQTNSQPSPRVN